MSLRKTTNTNVEAETSSSSSGSSSSAGTGGISKAVSALSAIAGASASTASQTYHALNDSSPAHTPGSPFSTIRHTRPWVVYQGTATSIPMSILGSKPLPEEHKITLQRRGWRTGLLGWTLGGALGGTLSKEIDVTPATQGSWERDVESKQRAQYDKEIQEWLSSSVAPKDHSVLGTALIHIPVAAGDGYYRLLVYPNAKSRAKIAHTSAFRVGSLSFSSATPRGASPMTVVPELVLRSGSAVGYTAGWTAFYAAFPFIKVAQWMPGNWGNTAMNTLYRLAGGEQVKGDLMNKYKVEERRAQAEESVYKNVPFGAAGVRTAYDLEEDARKGRGGIFMKR